MKKVFLLIIATLMLTGCEAIFEAATGAKKHALGNPYEVMVVCDDAVWESELGAAIRKALATEAEGLPQAENSFTVSRISIDDFTGVKMLFRNILFVKIDENYFTSPAFRFTRDVNAESQIIMTIQAPTIESCEEYVSNKSKTIVNFFNKVERERQEEILSSNYNQEANNLVNKMFGCSLKIPLNITGKKVGKDFLWLSDMNTPNPDIKNFAIYSYPYTGPSDFTMENFIHMRDSMMMENIQGTYEGQYPETDKTSVTLNAISHNDRYVLIARGLWRMLSVNKTENMGGPFVSYSVVDEVNQRVIVVETFLFAPNKRKADILRKLETSLYTLRLPIDKIMEATATADEVVIEANK